MYNSIFQKPWWLEAVAPGQWGAAEVKQGNEIIARLPYVRRRKFGRTILNQPMLTQTLGPWLRSSNAKYANQLAEQKKLMTELIHQLLPFDYFSQNFHYTITNWLPFYWQGFTQTTRYTYVIDDLSDIGKVWDGMLPNIRKDIKKAQNRFGIEVCTDLGIDAFLDVLELTFKRQGKQSPYPRDFVRRLDSACIAHDARKIFFGRDQEGRIHAAVHVIWDENSMHGLMGGGDPELRNSGATSLCIWEAIKHASTVTRCFNFGGSIVEPIERFMRAFGARQVPYFQITKNNSQLVFWGQAARMLKRAVVKN
jgi:hypothetical protein